MINQDDDIVTYTHFYEDYTRKAQRYHADTTRKDYNAQLWYELNRNDVCIDMLGDLCKGKKVLDLGASHWVEKHMLNKLGIYESATKVDIAPNPEETDFIKCDACHTPFKDKSFDIVITRELIEHVINADDMMKEINRVLVDDGYLFIATPNAYSLPPDGDAHRRGFTPRGFLALMMRFNFKVLDKRGNVPNVFITLMPLSELGYEWPIQEYKELAELIKNFEHSYYFGTNMFILAKKEAK
jgi:SAM-dependent methyltransferase